MFKKFLIAGALVWLPIIATIWIIRFLDSLFNRLMDTLPTAYQPDSWFPFHIPGLGIIIAIIILLLTGIFVTNFFGHKVIQWTDMLMKRVPLVGTLYSSIKQILKTIISSDGKSFRKVLLVEFPREGLWSIAFLTSDANDEINEVTKQKMITAFIPTTPNPTSGFLIMLPKDKVHELPISIEQAFKIVVSVGTLAKEDVTKHFGTHLKK